MHSNVGVVRQFFSRNPGRTQAYGTTNHTFLRDCPTDVAITELLAKLQTDGTDWESSYTVEFLARLLLSGRLPSLNVLWMSQGATRTRSCSKDSDQREIENQIENLMQGRTPGRQPTDPDYYPGDREIHGNRVQLQVHLVQLRGSQGIATALALYMPDDPRYDLRYVVRDEMP